MAGQTIELAGVCLNLLDAHIVESRVFDDGLAFCQSFVLLSLVFPAYVFEQFGVYFNYWQFVELFPIFLHL